MRSKWSYELQVFHSHFQDFFDQSLDEIKLLKYINVNGNVDDNHVLRWDPRVLGLCQFVRSYLAQHWTKCRQLPKHTLALANAISDYQVDRLTASIICFKEKNGKGIWRPTCTDQWTFAHRHKTRLWELGRPDPFWGLYEHFYHKDLAIVQYSPHRPTFWQLQHSSQICRSIWSLSLSCFGTTCTNSASTTANVATSTQMQQFNGRFVGGVLAYTISSGDEPYFTMGRLQKISKQAGSWVVYKSCVKYLKHKVSETCCSLMC